MMDNKTLEKDFVIAEELKKLPAMPGVYLMHGAMDEVIYVGKAKVLKNRVKQYFQKSTKKSVKIQQMVAQIQRFEYIVVDSEIEALVLESNLIKEYKPRYNTLLKDDKAYPYIRLSIEEPYPRLFASRSKKIKASKYYGPYASMERVNEVIELLRRTMHIRNCNKVFSESNPLPRPCIYYDMGQCLGPCVLEQTKEEYRASIPKITEFLSGKTESTVKELEEKMMSASENLDFEKAMEYRDLIQAIHSLQNQQKITALDGEDRDIIGLRRDHSDCIVQIFFVRDGKIIGRDHQFLRIDEEQSDGEILASFLQQFYNGTPFIPREIHLPVELPEQKVLEEWLSYLKNKKVYILVPKQGDKEKLVELAGKNAGILMLRYVEKYRLEEKKRKEALEELKQACHLKNLPQRIESYDISNTSGALTVGSMVVYMEGKEKPNEYRKFRIQSIVGQDDYGAMKEMLSRRFSHGLREREENRREGKEDQLGRFSQFPDLILMDGGKGQVGICEAVLESLGISIPVCGMIKDEHHRTRALLVDNQEYPLSERSECFKLLTRIQDEVHRFAITYHRSLRGKEQIHSLLEDIPGIGPVRRKALMRKFRNLEGIAAAGLEDLLSCPGMDEKSSRAVLHFFENRNRMEEKNK
jgi:excinuclease ABC, C subunit